MSTFAAKAETVVKLVILLVVGAMAGAASFTHVHDWTLANSPTGTPEWFGWANAVISELLPIAAGMEARRRTKHNQSITYPVIVLVAAVLLSLSAQFAQATPSISGWLLAAVPAVAFLALTKLALAPTPRTGEPAEAKPSPGPMAETNTPAAPTSAPPLPAQTPRLVAIPADALAKVNGTRVGGGVQ